MATLAPEPGALEQKLIQAQRLAPYNIVAHAWLIHRDDRDRRIRAAAHHQVIASILQDRKRFPYVVIVCPPGYSKSTLGSIVYPTWRLGTTGGNIRMGLISNTATQAIGFSNATARAVETEAFRRTYPDAVRDPGRKWTEKERFFRNTPEGSNPALLAAGMDGPILGKRFDEIVLDDPTTWDQARSEKVMEEQRNKLLNTLIQRFPAGARPPHGDGSTRMVVLMTRYGERDLLPTFVQLGFEVIVMPALGYWDRLIECGECGRRKIGIPPCDHFSEHEITLGNAALWPEKEPRDALEKMREHDQIIFELIYQANVSILSGDVFDATWWRTGEPPRRFDLIVMGVDTAGGRDRKRNDYTAIAVLGIRGEDVWLLYAWRDRLSAPKQEAQIVTAYELMRDRDLRPEIIYIEDRNEGRAVFDHLRTETRLPLKAVAPTTDKEFRAIPLSNAARRGDFWFPLESSFTRAVQAELEAFPEGAHDDFVDAITLAYNETPGGGHHGPRLRVLG